MGTWMADITKPPTLAEMIDFAKDAAGTHVYWADRNRTDPASVPPEVGGAEFHDECAILHSATADELEKWAKAEGEKNPGCINPIKIMRRTGRQLW